MANRRWNQEETQLALFLYFQLPFGKLHSGNPEIKQLANALGRSPSSIAMKLCNFASLDPKITDSGRKGLTSTSKLDREIFEKFRSDWTSLIFLTAELWDERVISPIDQSSVTVSDKRAPFVFRPFERESASPALVQQRRGQEFFRKAVLANFDERCCITGIADTRLLNASHIMPWGLDHENRHNPSNGLALSATFDRAFDRGLLTIDILGRIKISRQLTENSDRETRNYFLPYDGGQIKQPKRFDPDPNFISWHNKNCYIDS